MTSASRTLGGSTTVDGHDYAWRLHQTPRGGAASVRRGLIIALRRVDGDREALVEWPLPAPPADSKAPPKRANIDATFLTISVRSALTAGWDPRSKGRPVPVLVSRTEAAAFA
jgi:hypothetical protein